MVGMTAAHNAARAAVVPSATPPLPAMAWSSTVAASAQAWANNCVFADTGPPYGSNAFAGTGKYTPAQVVASWVSEDADYDYAANTCSADCGHYTQVVWRDSVGLGCGMATCTKNSPFGGSGAWQLWICNYNPPGNYVGEKPY
jgi:pathogenesis-related protein 1